MQRIFCVKFTMDSRFVISGSDDGNIRLWKAEAQAKLGALNPKQQAALEYGKAIKERYKHMPEIKRIEKYVVYTLIGPLLLILCTDHI
jgi:WD repeat and SOF domain-containing protein 1